MRLNRAADVHTPILGIPNYNPHLFLRSNRFRLSSFVLRVLRTCDSPIQTEIFLKKTFFHEFNSEFSKFKI